KPDRRLSVQKQFTGTRQKNPLRNDPAADFFLCAYDKFPIFSCKSAGNYGIIIISTDSQRCQTGA
ncbi:hypothetical protein, partial [uncultured Ruminococcus sp.]|uniref:hypothetical protein n=1 Tax=uncultured Ruminococcus sp. TaxID=165186 RepID=UPI002593C5BF